MSYAMSLVYYLKFAEENLKRKTKTDIKNKNLEAEEQQACPPGASCLRNL